MAEPHDSGIGSMNTFAVSLLVFSAELSAEEITSRLGIEPTDVARKGDVVDDDEHLSHHMWGYDVDPTEHASFDSQVDMVLERFAGKEAVLRELAQNGDVHLYCGCFLAELIAQIQLSPAQVEWLARAGARFKWAVYRVGEPAPDEPAPLAPGTPPRKG